MEEEEAMFKEDWWSKWDDVLNELWYNSNDSCHELAIANVEWVAPDSPLLNLDGIWVEYPNYKALEEALGKLLKDGKISLVILLYKCHVSECELTPEKVKVIAIDASGVPVHPS
jgi:hypothetical protein